MTQYGPISQSPIPFGKRSFDAVVAGEVLEHLPEQGRWLASAVRGHLAYHAVRGNIEAVEAFRDQATRHWYRAIPRRCHRGRLNWERIHRLARRWLPPAWIMHPWPDARTTPATQGRSPGR